MEQADAASVPKSELLLMQSPGQTPEIALVMSTTASQPGFPAPGEEFMIQAPWSASIFPFLSSDIC